MSLGGPPRDTQLLGREDPLEEGMATPSITLAWRIPWTEEPRGLQFMGLQSQIGRASCRERV